MTMDFSEGSVMSRSGCFCIVRPSFVSGMMTIFDSFWDFKSLVIISWESLSLDRWSGR